MKKFHDSLKTVYGPKSFGTTPLISTNGRTLLRDKDAIVKRCIHVACSIVNQLSMTMPSTACQPWSAMYCLMNFQLSLKQRKQFSICHRGRPLVQTQYIFKAESQPMAEKRTELFHCMCGKEAILQEFRDASIIHLIIVYKRNGNAHVCDNRRGISLLSIAGTIITD